VARSTTELLAAVRRAGFFPDASDQSSADLLILADQELETLISEAVVSGRGEHWFRTEDTTITAGTASYRLPRRVLGRAIRAVAVVPPAGAAEYQLTQLDPVELRGMFSTTATANPAYFAFEGDFIKLGAVPASSDWTLRVHYVQKPSQMVPVSTTTMARVASVPTTTTLTLHDTSPDANITTSLSYLDIIRGCEPYDAVYIDRLTSSYANPTLTLNAGTPIVVAEFTMPPGITTFSAKPGAEAFWVVQRDQTPFPPIPAAMWTALVYATTAAALAATRDPGTAQMAARAMAAKSQAIAMMEPRDERQTQTIINRSSPLRSGGRSWRWR